MNRNGEIVLGENRGYRELSYGGFDIDRVVAGYAGLSDSSNRVVLYGEVLGVEEDGDYMGIPSDLVLVRTCRSRNKGMYVWVLVSKDVGIRDLVGDGMYVYVEGYLNTVYTFNDLAVSHTFVVPEVLCEYEGLFELPSASDFSLNYTLHNRVELVGVVDREPWREYIPPAKASVTRFSVEYEVEGRKRRVYCTVWDSVNDLGEIRKGDCLRLLGSFTMLKKERDLEYGDGVVTHSRKNKLDSYVVIVQSLELLDRVCV